MSVQPGRRSSLVIRPVRHPELCRLTHTALAGAFSAVVLFDLSQRFREIIYDFYYLTHWNFLFQTIYSNLEMASDYSESFAIQTDRLRSRLFHCVVFPFSAFVGFYFWILYCIDDTMVLPENVEERMNPFYNHMMHTFILLAIILQTYTSYHRPPALLHRSILITILLGTAYLFLILAVASLSGQFPYGVFYKLNSIEITFLIIFAFLGLAFFHLVGRKFHEYVWLET